MKGWLFPFCLAQLIHSLDRFVSFCVSFHSLLFAHASDSGMSLLFQALESQGTNKNSKDTTTTNHDIVMVGDGGGGDDASSDVAVVVRVLPKDTATTTTGAVETNQASGSKMDSSVPGTGAAPPKEARDTPTNHPPDPASSAAAAAAAAAAAGDAPTSPSGSNHNPPHGTITYTKPKNFAERLMTVLQSEVCLDSLYWVANGKAVGLIPKHLKKGTILKDHFNVKDYSGFIRNCNRWYVSSLMDCIE